MLKIVFQKSKTYLQKNCQPTTLILFFDSPIAIGTFLCGIVENLLSFLHVLCMEVCPC